MLSTIIVPVTAVVAFASPLAVFSTSRVQRPHHRHVYLLLLLPVGTTAAANPASTADATSTSPTRPCARRSQNRIDTVKKKYKVEKARIAEGGGPSKWMFFEKLDRLFGPKAKYDGENSPNLGTKSQSQSKQMKGGEKVLKGQRVKTKKRGRIVSESEKDDDDDDKEEDSMDSLPPPKVKKPEPEEKRKEMGGARGRGDAVRELTRAIESFGDVYETTENAKLKEVVEMEKQRMKFAKEMEVQRMHFFMKRQVEISQMKYGRKAENKEDGGSAGGGKSGDHHDDRSKISDEDVSERSEGKTDKTSYPSVSCLFESCSIIDHRCCPGTRMVAAVFIFVTIKLF